MQYEYHKIDIDAGDEISIEQLNELGKNGYKLVTALPYSEDTSGPKYPDGTGWIDSHQRKYQLIFIKERVLNGPSA